MSLTRFEDNHEIDEETPFLPNQEAVPDSNTTRTPVTPLPISQISVLLTAWLRRVYHIPLVRELPDVGGDVRKVGYYTGIIVRLTFSKRADVDQTACQVSLHYAAIAATSFQWNRLSDHVGRKPVLLSCLMGTSLSILLFGLSHSFWALVLSRCLHGAVKGHIGAVISTIAELTDETNVARGFSMPPVAWSLGYVIGPLVGGVLSRPQDRWPHIFSHPFWADYPYFLPCLVAATFTCFSFVITALYLEETLNSKPSRLQFPRPNSDTPQGEAGDTPGLDMSPDESQKPLPLRSVLTKPVIITIANYAMLALIDAMASAYIPLVWSTPVEYGGLNLSPASIGLWLSLYGVMDGIFQFIFFSHFVSRFGLRRVFVFSLVSCAVVYVLFPLENLAVVVGGGPNPVVWLLIILQLLSYCIFDMGFGAIYMYTSSAAPNKRSLGAAYGLSQVATSIQNAVGPASADWLFAFSLYA
ncbi:MFS general substrate transporter [Lactarius pseudohatsudake]|nr:MFS general substrate transporter [Lactarius pseudohatsudake]